MKQMSMNDLPELYTLFYLSVLSATGLIPITTRKKSTVYPFPIHSRSFIFSLYSNFCQNIVYVTEPPHKQFPAGFLQDSLDYIFPVQKTEL